MFKNILLGKKIAIGFGAVLVLMIVVALVGFKSLTGSSKGFDRYRQIAGGNKYNRAEFKPICSKCVSR